MKKLVKLVVALLTIGALVTNPIAVNAEGMSSGGHTSVSGGMSSGAHSSVSTGGMSSGMHSSVSTGGMSSGSHFSGGSSISSSSHFSSGSSISSGSHFSSGSSISSGMHSSSVANSIHSSTSGMSSGSHFSSGSSISSGSHFSSGSNLTSGSHASIKETNRQMNNSNLAQMTQSPMSSSNIHFLKQMRDSHDYKFARDNGFDFWQNYLTWRMWYYVNMNSYGYYYYWMPYSFYLPKHNQKKLNYANDIKKQAQKQGMKWIKVNDTVIAVPERLYNKIHVGDQITLVDQKYLKINGKIYKI